MYKEQTNIRDLVKDARTDRRIRVEVEVCPVCGGLVKEIKAKAICTACGRIIRGCCE